MCVVCALDRTYISSEHVDSSSYSLDRSVGGHPYNHEDSGRIKPLVRIHSLLIVEVYTWGLSRRSPVEDGRFCEHEFRVEDIQITCIIANLSVIGVHSFSWVVKCTDGVC